MELMDELGALFLRTAYSIPDAHAKALASYIFRQVIEDVHVKYSISQQDMMAMNKAALNRASLFVNKIKDDPKLYAAFAMHAVEVSEWDDAEITADEVAELKCLASML